MDIKEKCLFIKFQFLRSVYFVSFLVFKAGGKRKIRSCLIKGIE